MPKFSERSLAKLGTCHRDLQDLFNEVIKHVDCTILCGHRGEAAQEKAVLKGYSKAHFPNSKHNTFPSIAADVVPYPIDWSDKERFYYFAGVVQGIASQRNINIKWGGSFKSFFDGPHYQLEL